VSTNAAALQLHAITLSEAIRELGQIPSGHLYARVMEHIDVHSYQVIIDALVRAKLITNQHHLLTWVGPRFDS